MRNVNRIVEGLLGESSVPSSIISALAVKIDKYAKDPAAHKPHLSDPNNNDIKALGKVEDLLKAGNVSGALKAAKNLDSYVRDVIPDSVWDYMEDEA